MTWVRRLFMKGIMVHNGYWNELNLKGIVDYHRRPKKAAGALREAYL